MATPMPCSITDGPQYDETLTVEIPDGYTLISALKVEDAVELIGDALYEPGANNNDDTYLTDLVKQFRDGGGARKLMERPRALRRFLATFESCLQVAGETDIAIQRWEDMES